MADAAVVPTTRVWEVQDGRSRLALPSAPVEGQNHHKFFEMADWLMKKARVAQDDLQDVLQVFLETYGITTLDELQQNGLPKAGSIVRCGPYVSSAHEVVRGIGEPHGYVSCRSPTLQCTSAC